MVTKPPNTFLNFVSSKKATMFVPIIVEQLTQSISTIKIKQNKS